MIEVKAFELYLSAAATLIVGLLVLIAYFDLKKSIVSLQQKSGTPITSILLEQPDAVTENPRTLIERR